MRLVHLTRLFQSISNDLMCVCTFLVYFLSFSIFLLAEIYSNHYMIPMAFFLFSRKMARAFHRALINFWLSVHSQVPIIIWNVTSWTLSSGVYQFLSIFQSILSYDTFTHRYWWDIHWQNEDEDGDDGDAMIIIHLRMWNEFRLIAQRFRKFFMFFSSLSLSRSVSI